MRSIPYYDNGILQTWPDETLANNKPTSNNYDPVNHPPHYTSGRKFETIEVIEDWFFGNYHLGQVCKYISRAGRKGGTHDELNDLDKAAWYLARYREMVAKRLREE